MKTLNGMTNQQIFDASVSALLTQGSKSWGVERGGCAYRGDGGTKCAIGILMDDDVYDPLYDDKDIGGSVHKMYIEFPRFKTFVGGVDLTFLSCLQDIHDDAGTGEFFVFDLKRRAKTLADQFNLNGSVAL